MNRLFFRPEQCGMTKTDAAAQVSGPADCILQAAMPNLYLHKEPFMHNLCLHAPFIANWQVHVPRCFATPAGMCVPCPSPQTLAGINPDVALESYTMNITTLEVHCLLQCPLVWQRCLFASCFAAAAWLGWAKGQG